MWGGGGEKGARKLRNGGWVGRGNVFLLSSSQQGLLCPQGPPWLPFSKPEGGDRGEVAHLGLGCDGKQEVPVISQEGSTVGREPGKLADPQGGVGESGLACRTPGFPESCGCATGQGCRPPTPPIIALFSTHGYVSTVTCQRWPNIHGPTKDECD